MATLRFENTVLCTDPTRGCVTSLTVGKTALLAAESPLFTFRVRTADAEIFDFSSMQGTLCKEESSDTALVLT